jgi:hypothetical protein
MEDDENEEQKEARGSGGRDMVLPTALLKGAVGCGHRWVSLGWVLGCVAKAKHIPVVLEERLSNTYGLVPMSLAL